MAKLFKCNLASDRGSSFISVCGIHVQRQPGLAAPSEDTGCTNKRRSKWISRLCRPRTRCLCSISCFASRQTEDMKISESTQPAASTWWTFFFFVFSLPLLLPWLRKKTKQQTHTHTEKKTTKNTKPDHYSQGLLLKTTCNTSGYIHLWSLDIYIYQNN